MKTLKDYILQEKLHLNKDLKVDEYVTVDIPKIDENSSKAIDEVWKSFEIPNKKFVVFSDYYRNKSYHLAETVDMLLSIWWGEEDFEDFDPKKDILLSSDDLKEITEQYLDLIGFKIDMNDYKGLDETETRIEMEDDLQDQNNKVKKHNFSDCFEFFINVLTGKWTNDTYDTDKTIKLDSFYKDIMNLK